MGKHIYIHIPFCKAKCPYCSFYSIESTDEKIFSNYVEALMNEIDFWGTLYAKGKFIPKSDNRQDTIYIGGGTPSLLSGEQISQILERISQRFNINLSKAEVTLEVNPFTATGNKLFEIYEAKVNRLSIGVQSLNDGTLKTLGRIHDADTAIRTLKAAGVAGFKNISADLIIGVPNQSKTEIITSAQTLVNLGVKHISTYSLSIEEGTKFYHKYRYLDDYVSQEKEREMYHGLIDFLESNGYKNYEISNSSLPGFESNHNLSCWECSEYYAFGPGAHFYIDDMRMSHKEDVIEYIKSKEVWQTATEIGMLLDKGLILLEEKLNAFDMMKEFMLLNLRKRDGLSPIDFQKKFNRDVFDIFSEEILRLKNNDLIVCNPYEIRLSDRGVDFANLVFEEFV